MNDAQWLWSYYNIAEDEEEEREKQKLIIEDIFYIVNPSRYFDYIKAKKDAIKSTLKFSKMTQADYDAILKDAAQFTEIIPEKKKTDKPDYDEIY